MRNSASVRRWGAVVGVAALAVTAIAVNGTSSAATTEKKLNVTCTPPIGGAQKAASTLKVTLPDAVKVGEAVNATMEFTAVLPAAQIQQLATLLGADGMDYEATYNNTWEGAATGAAKGTGAVKGFALPAAGQDATIVGQVKFDAVTPTAAGPLTMKAGDVAAMITPLKGGAPTNLGTVATPCTIDAGQDVTLASVTVA